MVILWIIGIVIIALLLAVVIYVAAQLDDDR